MKQFTDKERADIKLVLNTALLHWDIEHMKGITVYAYHDIHGSFINGYAYFSNERDAFDFSQAIHDKYSLYGEIYIRYNEGVSLWNF